MRNSNWLVAAALLVVVAVASGCETAPFVGDPPAPPPPPTGRATPLPGVVEIYRNSDPHDPAHLLGYYSDDGARHWCWLLREGESVPDWSTIDRNRVGDVYLDGPQLCETYGAGIAPCQVWDQHGASSPCNPPMKVKK